MAPSSRDRISVDLHGLKAVLLERARTANVIPSELVRAALADALGRPVSLNVHRASHASSVQGEDRTRLSLRMPRTQAETVVEAARQAGMNTGDYVASLVAGVPVLINGGRRADNVAALAASCAELSSVSRNVRHLALLMREDTSQRAQEQIATVDLVANNIGAHLRLAATVLAELRPRGASGAASMNSRR